MDPVDSSPFDGSQALIASQSDRLPPLQKRHLFFFAMVAALLAILFRSVSIGAAPVDVTAMRSVGNLLHWEAVYLGLATWGLGVVWFATRKRGFALQPAPWLIMMQAVATGSFSNILLCLENALWGNDGSLRQLYNHYWGLSNWWYAIPDAIVAAALVCLALVPRRISDVGAIWRLLLLLIGARGLLAASMGLMLTAETPSWTVAVFRRPEIQWLVSLALGAAAMIQDAFAGRPRHWSQWWCAGLWMAAYLGLVLAIN